MRRSLAECSTVDELDNRPPPTKDVWTRRDTLVAVFFALLYGVFLPAVAFGFLSYVSQQMRGRVRRE